jgi:hypothetical protein
MSLIKKLTLTANVSQLSPNSYPWPTVRIGGDPQQFDWQNTALDDELVQPDRTSTSIRRYHGWKFGAARSSILGDHARWDETRRARQHMKTRCTDCNCALCLRYYDVFYPNARS